MQAITIFGHAKCPSTIWEARLSEIYVDRTTLRWAERLEWSLDDDSVISEMNVRRALAEPRDPAQERMA